jgi:hypothetical protein
LVTECSQGGSGNACKDPPNPGSLTETLPPGQVDKDTPDNSSRDCDGPPGLVPPNCK